MDSEGGETSVNIYLLKYQSHLLHVLDICRVV